MERWMSLDVGDRRIGVAVSDPLGFTAQGIEVYHRKKLSVDLDYLSSLFQQREAGGLVVGLPKNMNGTIGPQAEAVMDFGRKLGKRCGVKPVFWDERLSTVQATQVLVAADLTRKKRRNIVDQVSAVIILQGFLDAGTPHPSDRTP